MNKSAASKRRTRLAAIAALGGQCAHCGIDDPVVLNIDHVQNDGASERKRADSTQLCARIVKGAVSKSRYQLLCCNCNWRKEYLRRTKTNVFVEPPDLRVNQNYDKTACVNGHPFDDANTYVRANGHRSCRKCGLEAQKQYAKRKSETGQVNAGGEPRVAAAGQTH